MSEREGTNEPGGADEIGAARDALHEGDAVATSAADTAPQHRIYRMSFASVYPLYIQKIERKGRTKAELDEVIAWLTGFDAAAIRRHLADETTFREFFDDADLNPDVSLITGVVCGVRVEQIEDPLMRRIRYLDKLVDELAKGKPMAKVLRTA